MGRVDKSRVRVGFGFLIFLSGSGRVGFLIFLSGSGRVRVANIGFGSGFGLDFGV